ncbi:hypothetical protein [Kribbella sp. NPDC048928]|uniref:maleate cis-trans isomerase family protein n=1 Tax=Kribbella sp. NPDC048928 TaxID=3364111 RepID=UPI0037186CF5
MKVGEKITVGVLTPHTAAGADVEFPELAPGLVRVETSRVRPVVGVARVEALRAQAEVLDDAASILSPAADVLGIASTSLGYAVGYAAETALVERLRARWDVPVCSTSLSAVAALRLRQVRSVSLVHPPWFGQSLNDLGAEYFRSQGFEVVEARLADLPDDPDKIEPAMVVEYVAQHLSPRADAVFLGGNGFRAARAVHALETRTRRLVLEANQVLLWSVLRSAGAPTALAAFGTLLAVDNRTTNAR